jgi:prepilin-type N-terminal cleavage/methylation domain-containing protein/prepilin-type processing-associated H-X9-DG protein
MSTRNRHWCRATSSRDHGFTLIEVLVVAALIALLVAILVPSLVRGRQVAIQSACMSGLRQVGVAIHAYAADNGGCIPYGPKSPPPSATNFYPLTGNVTSLISLESGTPVGLALLLKKHLGREKGALFCPGADQPSDVQAALAAVGVAQVEASYYYRHASVAMLSGPLPPPRVKLDRLGDNRNGAPIRCLAADTQFIAPPMMAMFNVRTRTHHQQRVVNALYVDAHVSTHKNVNDRYQVDVAVSVYDSLSRILTVLEALDRG